MTRKIDLFSIFVVSSLAVFLVFPALVSSQEPQASPSYIGSDGKPSATLPYTQNPPNFFGQDHSYSVTFRGNGEAVISLKVIFSNLTDKPLQKLTFRVPLVDPKDLGVYQVVREGPCLRYAPVDSPQERLRPICLESQEPDYFQAWYGQAEYAKAKVELKGDNLLIDLVNPVKVNGSGSLVLYYRAFGYASKNFFGAWDYTFETLMAEDKVRDLTVGITTDADLLLRGVKGKVNYRFEAPALVLKSVGETQSMVKSPEFDAYYSQIGLGVVTKKASNLQPLESFSVKGSYADSFLKLYAKELLAGLAVCLIGLFFLFWSVRWILAKVRRPKNLEAATVPLPGGLLDFLLVFALSFIFSLLIAGYTFLLNFLGNYFNQIYASDLRQFLIVFLFVLSVGVYAVLLFAPAVVLGIKRGVLWGLAVFGATVLWLIFYFLALVVFIFLFQRSSYPRSYTEILPTLQRQVEPSSK